MRQICTVNVLVAAIGLAGCSYQPPAAGPMATINLSIHSHFGLAQFNIMPTAPGPINDGDALDTGFAGGKAQTTTTVPAGKVFLAFTESLYNGRCSSNFGFNTEPDETYAVAAGDTPPQPLPPSAGIFEKMARNEQPGHGARCYIHVTHVRHDGSQTAVAIWGWRMRL